jgi:hypothetical protein
VNSDTPVSSAAFRAANLERWQPRSASVHSGRGMMAAELGLDALSIGRRAQKVLKFP